MVSRTTKHSRLARQLALFETGDDAGEETEPQTSRVELEAELERFRAFMRNELHRPLAENTIDHRERVLRRVIKLTGHRFTRELLADLPALRLALADAKKRAYRHQRFLVITDAALAILGEDAGLKVIDSLLEEMPGRNVRHGHLLEEELGGDTKATRTTSPLTFAQAMKYVDAAGEFGGLHRTGVRDRALMAAHLFTGMKPARVVALTWEEWNCLKPFADGLSLLPDASLRGFGGYLVHEKAVEEITAYARRQGNPLVGHVFTTERGTFGALEPRSVGAWFGRCYRQAGLPLVDRRRLRAPFALALVNRGFDKLKLSRSFGFDTVRAFEDWLAPAEEAQAQLRVAEFREPENGRLVEPIPEGPPRSRPAAMPHRRHMADAVIPRQRSIFAVP